MPKSKKRKDVKHSKLVPGLKFKETIPGLSHSEGKLQHELIELKKKRDRQKKKDQENRKA